MHASVFIALAKFRHLSGITGDYILTGLFYTGRERTRDTHLLNAVVKHVKKHIFGVQTGSSTQSCIMKGL